MKVSIITVCYNDRVGLEKTIASVAAQVYEDLEYIVVDGGSNDGTIEAVAEHQKHFPIQFISEPDEGIYDAMNKGVALSSGDWLNFMNAGDTFYRNDSVVEAVARLLPNDDIIYGDTEIRYRDFSTIKKEPAPDKLWMGRVAHQSAFIKSSTMKRYGYNKNNKIVADLEFFMTVAANGGRIRKIDQVVASFAKDGVTERQDRRVIHDAYQTVKSIKPNLRVDIYYRMLMMKPFFKRMLPRRLFIFIKDIMGF